MLDWLIGTLADVAYLLVRVWWVLDPYEEGRWVWNWLRLAFWIILIAMTVYLLLALLR